jgi:hypothetical protein
MMGMIFLLCMMYLNWNLLMMDSLWNSWSLHGFGEVGVLNELVSFLQDRLILSLNLFGITFLEIDSDLVVDERKNHAVMDGDQVRGLVLGVLFGALHKDEGSIGGHLILAFLWDEPTLLLSVGYVAVVCRYSLQPDLYFPLLGTSNWEEVLLESLQNDFLLDTLLIFIRAHPSWTRSQGGRVSSWGLLYGILIIMRSHNVEWRCWLLSGSVAMGNLVEVVVDYFAQIDQRVLLDLNLG